MRAKNIETNIGFPRPQDRRSRHASLLDENRIAEDWVRRGD